MPFWQIEEMYLWVHWKLAVSVRLVKERVVKKKKKSVKVISRFIIGNEVLFTFDVYIVLIDFVPKLSSAYF